MAKKGSKNNIENRGTAAKLREINGKQVKPVEYRGANLGHGNYIAAMYVDSGQLVRDQKGKPIPYQQI
jgi:hypothetical protein